MRGPLAIAALLAGALPACTSWHVVTRDEILAFARQPNVNERSLVVDGELRRVGGETPVILHLVGGEVGPASSRSLHGDGEALRLDEPARELSPADIDAAEVRLYDARKTTLVIAVPAIAVAVTGLIILVVSFRNTFNPL